ncbi:MAG: IS1595 family transposase [Hyphomicrobium sp.]
MKSNPSNPIFHDEDAARAHLEAQRWPDGPICPRCGEAERVHRLEGKSHRKGLCQCNACLQPFSVTVGTVMERSHVQLTKWVLGFHKMAASKKGISAKQLQRELGLGSYRTAWFMAMRIREAMRIDTPPPIGGEGKIVESDETYVGGKGSNAHKRKPIPKKHAVVALVERGGEVRAKHIPTVSIKTLRKAIDKNADKRSHLMTDELPASKPIGATFAAHGRVVHSAGEYVSKDGMTHTQTVESFFAILKRGVMGSFHSVSEQHLQRYVDEFSFRWNTRSSLGIEDVERANRAMKGAEGKRLTYRQPD